MDNNQQAPNAKQGGSPNFTDPIFPHTEVNPSVTNLGLNSAKPMAGTSVQSPLSGADVSMTTPQAYGGPIVSTEQGKVSNQTGPNA
jgi:hypothetical protein